MVPSAVGLWDGIQAQIIVGRTWALGTLKTSLLLVIDYSQSINHPQNQSMEDQNLLILHSFLLPWPERESMVTTATLGAILIRDSCHTGYQWGGENMNSLIRTI